MLRCKEEAGAAKAEPASPSAGAAKKEPAGPAAEGAAVDFIATFGGGKSFAELVAAAEPHAGSAQLQQTFAQRLEDFAESDAEEWQVEVTEAKEEAKEEEAKEEEEAAKEDAKEEAAKEEEQVVPPWRREPAASSASATVGKLKPGHGLLHLRVSRDPAEPTEPPLKMENLPQSEPPVKMENLPQSGPSAFNYGPGTGSKSKDRFFDNGHLTSLMIDLGSRMRQCFKLVLPSFKFELFIFWFLSQEHVYVCHIQGDPFKRPDSYKGSQREWERAHGHERERGGVNLDTLIYVFTVRDHLALFREQSNY